VNRRTIQGIIYRLSRAEGCEFGAESIRMGFELELHRLPTLVAPGALQDLLRWKQQDRSLLVAKSTSVYTISIQEERYEP
jgi:hypothetical protein